MISLVHGPLRGRKKFAKQKACKNEFAERRRKVFRKVRLNCPSVGLVIVAGAPAKRGEVQERSISTLYKVCCKVVELAISKLLLKVQ